MQPCFSKNSQLTSLNCPFCKKRIGTWHRRAKNVDTLINQHLWTYIRDNFGDKVNARMNAEEVDGEIFQVGLHRIYSNLFKEEFLSLCTFRRFGSHITWLKMDKSDKSSNPKFGNYKRRNVSGKKRMNSRAEPSSRSFRWKRTKTIRYLLNNALGLFKDALQYRMGTV